MNDKIILLLYHTLQIGKPIGWLQHIVQIWLARTSRVEVARHNPKLLNSLSTIAISNYELTRDP